jgi:hypothetical protein
MLSCLFGSIDLAMANLLELGIRVFPSLRIVLNDVKKVKWSRLRRSYCGFWGAVFAS